MQDKVALITGAAKRVGAAIARHLHGAGMRVVVHCRSSLGEAEALAVELESARAGSTRVLQGDLLEVERLPGLVGDAAAAWGRLDLLVNNASSFYATPVGGTDEAAWEDLLGTNLRAPFFLAQAAAPHLAEARGSIVNITDIHAARPLGGFTVYSAAKAGLIALTRGLARDLGPEVRVNAVSPGAVLWAEQEADEAAREAILASTALGRLGTPDDIARTVLFLARDAVYCSGTVIDVDGGRF